jgi:shikimate kinase
MGAGKTTIGRRLAKSLGVPFIDADAEIEAAAGCTINDIFESHGEAEFRRGEQRVIERILTGPPHVLATGGGAFMNPDTRTLIEKAAVSIWLRADLDLLMQRVSKRDTRPLLKGTNPREVMEKLVEERYPVYALADIVVDSVDGPHDVMVKDIIDSLNDYYNDLKS